MAILEGGIPIMRLMSKHQQNEAVTSKGIHVQEKERQEAGRDGGDYSSLTRAAGKERNIKHG